MCERRTREGGITDIKFSPDGRFLVCGLICGALLCGFYFFVVPLYVASNMWPYIYGVLYEALHVALYVALYVAVCGAL